LVYDLQILILTTWIEEKKNVRISIDERVKKEIFKARKEHHAHHCCLGRPDA